MNHPNPDVCGLVSALHALEHAVAEWAEAKPRPSRHIDQVVANATERIYRAALIGSVTEGRQ